MGRYIIGKPQIKRLLEGKPVTDGAGRKFIAKGKVMEALQMIVDYNLFKKYEVILLEDGFIDIQKKEE